MENQATVSEWSCEQVYDWTLQQVGEKSAAMLRQEQVNGSALLVQTEASLRAFGIAGGQAAKLCLALKALHASPLQLQEMDLDGDFRVKLETHQQLQFVWDEIGTSMEDRQAYLNELSLHVQALYNSHLQEQRNARDTCEEKVRGLQACIDSLCGQLQIESPQAVSVSLPLLQQISSLTTQYDAVKQEKDRQQARNGKALAELAQLYAVLGDPLPDTHRLLLGAHRLAEIQDLITQTHQKIADKRVLLETAKAKVHAELQDLMFDNNEYTELDRLVLLGGADIPLSALDELVRRGVELEEIDATRKEKLKSLARKIANIWNILNIPSEHRKEFMAGNAGLGRATFEKCEQELADLEAQKRVQLPRLLEACEVRLRELWTETCTSQREQDNFFESYLEMNNEQKFTAIKQHIVDMEKRLEEMKPLLACVEKREQIKAEVDMYSALQSDPNRFKIAGLPLKLEQMRKNFQSFPKLAAKMKQDLEDWEATNGPFVRNGDRLLATMEANGEFEDGYVPGVADVRRPATLKAEPTFATPHKPARPATIPRSGQVTPVKREQIKPHSNQSLQSALKVTPNKEVHNNMQSTTKKALICPSIRKADRENFVEKSNNVKVSDGKHREKPNQDNLNSKRLRTPLKESNR